MLTGAVSASDYVNPYTVDFTPNGGANFNGGSVVDSGMGAVGGYNRFGNGNTTDTRESGVRVTSASGNQMLAMNSEGYYKITQTKKWATENAAGDDGISGTSYKSGGVSLAYTESNGSIRMGFNSIKNVIGNVYGKASFEISLKMEKSEDYYAGGYSTAFDKNISLYNSISPTSANEAAYIKLYHEDSYNTDGVNSNRYMALFGTSQAGASAEQKVMLNFGEWYSFKMSVDVLGDKVTYFILDDNDIVIKMYTAPLLKESTFIAPVISIQDLQRYGFDFYIKDIKVLKETLITPNIEIIYEEGKYIATASVANDVWADSDPVKAPRILFAAYTADGSLKTFSLSQDNTVEYKVSKDAEPLYETMLSAELNDADIAGCTKLYAIMWSDIYSMAFYNGASLEITVE